MLESLAGFIISVISTFGYPGIIVTMAIESALIPLPSEIIMPFSGYLASTGRFDLGLVVISGAFGNVLGALVIYGVGFWGHERIVRRFIRRFGKWIFISENELDRTEKLLHKYKNWVILGSRVLPGLRTVISLPAGIAKLPLPRFILLTFMGSLIWSFLLAWLGYVLGSNWKVIGPYFHKFEIIVIVLIVLTIGAYIYFSIKKHKPSL